MYVYYASLVLVPSVKGPECEASIMMYIDHMLIFSRTSTVKYSVSFSLYTHTHTSSAITSHLQTSGYSIVIGTNKDTVNKVCHMTLT